LIVIKAFFFLPARHFPDKAIDLVDKACATARLLMDRRKKQATSNDDILLVPKDENVGPNHIAQVPIVLHSGVIHRSEILKCLFVRGRRS
jgi:hypothetical protein